ncbi:MAG TPA: AsmA family protein, partial [Rubrivivax sp.]|nr:AsmA family protein [Rubrivivax sp.]
MVATLVCLALGAAIAALVAGVSFDLSRWRDAAAQRASTALGRPVALQGDLQLTLGRELVLRIGDVRVQNPSGFSAPQFVSIGEARVRIDLFDALRGQARLRGVEASDIALWLERASDGRGNWSLSQPHDPASPRAAFDVGLIKLHRLAVHYHDLRSATRRSLELDELSGSVRPNDPARLALRGRVDGRHPYLLRIEGASLQLLQQATEPWPFTLHLESAGGWLHAGGTLDTRQAEARFHLGGGADDLAQAGRLLGASLPQLGAATVSGTVVARADEIAVTGLQGMFAEAEFSGQLALSFGGARQRLSGALSLSAFDLRPFLGPDAQP